MIKTLLKQNIRFIFLLSFVLFSSSIVAQTLISIDHLQGASGNLVRGMFTGEAGHTAVCGDYQYNLSAGDGSDETTVTTVGVTSGYVAHYDENADLEFLLGLESSKFGTVQAVYVNEVNATYATGDYTGVMDLNPLGDSVEVTSTGFSPLISSSDPFLAKYDSEGNLDWHISPVESGDGYGTVIVPTLSESIVWAGHYNGYMQFEYEGETITYPGQGNSSFIFEVDSIGEITKHIRIAPVGTMVSGMIVNDGMYDAEGNLYLTGFIQGSVDIETPDEVYTIDTETVNNKFFIIQLLPDWSIGWHVTSDGDENGTGRGIAVNSEGDLIFGGYFSGEGYFSSSDGSNTDTIVSAGNRDIFMGKYTTTGNLVELYSLEGPYSDFLSSILLDEADQIYLVGSFSNSIDFDPSEDSSIIESGFGASSLFVAKYTPDFNFGWVYHAAGGVSSGEDAKGLGILDDGLMVAGDFNFIVDFNPNGDPVELTSSSGTDGFLVKITNPGIATSVQEFKERQFELFPNPTQDRLTISIVDNLVIDALTIYDLMGRIVYSKKVTNLISGQNITVDLPDLSPGLYVIALEGKETYTRNFIVSDSY